MNLASVLTLFGYGTSEGVRKEWDTRGRKSTDDIEERAVKEFGLTDNPREAGYLLQDGRMLDFSGKQQGSTDSGVRYMDHREINKAYPDDDDSDFHDFMRTTGAVRFGVYDGGITVDIQKDHQLSSSQIEDIRDAIPYAGKSPSLILEVVDDTGRRLSTAEKDDVQPEDVSDMYRQARRDAWTELHKDVHAGGPGSGCHGENCGRHPETGQLYDRVLYRGVGNWTPVDEGMRGKGEYWATDRHLAEGFASGGGTLRTGRIHLKNPYVTAIDNLEHEILPEYRHEQYRRGVTNEHAVNELVSKKLREVLESRGHDGAVLEYGPPNEDGSHNHEVVVFHPEKSVRPL